MWASGVINGYHFQAKHYEVGSEYGIGGGRISKLSIRKDGAELFNYDRSLDFDRLDREGKAVYAQILKKYN